MDHSLKEAKPGQGQEITIRQNTRIYSYWSMQIQLIFLFKNKLYSYILVK